MTKEKFLQQLKRELKPLPNEEQLEILQDYEEHFTFGHESGKTDEAIIDSLGEPNKLAKELLANYHVEQATKTGKLSSVIRGMFVLVGLGFFNLVFVLGFAIAIAAMIFAGWVVAGLLVAMPAIYLINVAIHPTIFGFFELFVTLACLGIGYFIGLFMWFISKLSTKLFARYLKFNYALVKGE